MLTSPKRTIEGLGGPLVDLPGVLVEALCLRGVEDDAAILLARFGRRGATVQSRELPIAPHADAVGDARRFTLDTIAPWPSSPDPADLVALVSEMVTNAIVHARPPVRLRLSHFDDEILVEVTDGASFVPRKLHPEPIDEHRAGVPHHGDALPTLGRAIEAMDKTVWCTVPITRP